MNSKTCNKYNSLEDADDLSVYGSTCSLNSSIYDSTVTDGRDNDSPVYTPLASPILDRFSRQSSLVDSLLAEIYSSRTRRSSHRRLTEDLTDCLPESNSVIGGGTNFGCENSDRSYLEQLSVVELRGLAKRWAARVRETSTRLLATLKQREKCRNQVEKNCRVVTTVLKSWLGRKESTKAEVHRVEPADNSALQLKFSLSPNYGEKSFSKWTKAVKVMTRHPVGIPDMLRPNIWLSLASCGLQDVDWQDVMRFAFSEHSNPDDDDLGIQIVKDLHRTGYSGYSAGDASSSKLSLKCVLLAYARWNKDVGYCQGFNVMVALLLQVMDGHEEDALKVMIYIIDRVMPPHYFSRNLHSLLADIEVFHGLMQAHLPKLYAHLLQLRLRDDGVSDARESYEPPLINVFTIQWFLTLFAVCLPLDCVLRLWDSILLEGSEVILCAGLSIWKLISPRLMSLKSSDEFYSAMEEISRQMQEGTAFESNELLEEMHGMARLSNVKELRDKYTYNVSPFRPMSSSMPSGDVELSSVGCLNSFWPHLSQWNFPNRILKKSLLLKPNRKSLRGTQSTYSANKTIEPTSVVELQKRYKEVQHRHQKAIVLVDMQGQNSVRKPLLDSKSTAAAIVKVKEDVGEEGRVDAAATSRKSVGLELVHPSIVKPFPQHKEQPSGHRRPLRSNLHGYSQRDVGSEEVTLNLPGQEVNSLRLNVDLAGLAGDSRHGRPINHLIDFLPHKQRINRRRDHKCTSKPSSTMVSAFHARQLQNERLGLIPPNSSKSDAYATYRRRMNTQLSSMRAKGRCLSSSLLAPSGGSVCDRSTLPLERSVVIGKGVSYKTVVHVPHNKKTRDDSKDENHHQRGKTLGTVDTTACSTVMAVAGDDDSSSSLRPCRLRLNMRNENEKVGRTGVLTKVGTRRSPPIDLLVTTVEDDSAAERQAEATLLSARPDLLITVASSHIS